MLGKYVVLARLTGSLERRAGSGVAFKEQQIGSCDKLERKRGRRLGADPVGGDDETGGFSADDSPFLSPVLTLALDLLHWYNPKFRLGTSDYFCYGDSSELREAD